MRLLTRIKKRKYFNIKMIFKINKSKLQAKINIFKGY